MKNIVVSLFDVTGKMVQPWLDAGYECWIVDIQHPVAYETGGVTTVGRLHKVHWDLTKPWLPPFDRDQIAAVFSFPPCDHLAVSGSRWFKGKGLRRLAASVEMFATAAEFCEWSKAPYFIENPVSNISSHWRKADHYFSPHHFTGYNLDDNYTKKTCLWTGNGFQMPDPFIVEGLGEPDDRIHKCPPGPERHNIRSATPRGFAEAVYQANQLASGAYVCTDQANGDFARKMLEHVTQASVTSKVLTEHSGCGQGTQVDQLTVRLNPGDKVVLVMGPYSAAVAKSQSID